MSIDTQDNTRITDSIHANETGEDLTDQRVLESVQRENPAVQLLGNYKEWHNQLDIPEIDGARIVRCIYQVNKRTQKKDKESVFAYIPDHIDRDAVELNLAELMPYFIFYLQSIEDQMIKADHRAGLTSIYTDSLSISKLCEYLEEQALGSRLNKEMVSTWFNNCIALPLTERMIDKLGIDDSSDAVLVQKLENIVASYKGMFESLASPKTIHKEADCKAMIRVINDLAGKEDQLSGKLVVKLEKMIGKANESLELY